MKFFLSCIISLYLNFSFGQTEFERRFGVFIAPTVGLDNIENEYYYTFIHGFGNDILPLVGISIEHKKSVLTHATKIGLEPILNWKSYYGFSADALQQLKFGKGFFQVAFGIGYMFRTLDHFTLRQHYTYTSFAPSITIQNIITIEPSYCLGFLYESTHHPDLILFNGDGRYFQDWFRINLVYHF